MAFSVIFVLLLFHFSFCFGGYRKFYVEDNCTVYGSKVTYNLTYYGYNSTMILRPSRTTYSPRANCDIYIVPPSGYQVVLAVRKIDFVNPFCVDKLTVYTSVSTSTDLCGFQYYSNEAKSFRSAGTMHLVYSTGNYAPNWNNIGFEITLTSISNYNCYDSNKFRCKNSLCISSLLKCDGHNNCGDLSDEEYGANGGCEKTWVGIIASSVVSVCIVIIIISLVVICCRRRRRIQREIIIRNTVLTSPSGYGTATNPPYAPSGGFISPGYSSAPPPPPYSPS